MSDRNVVLHINERYVVAEVPPEQVTEVVGKLRDVLDNPKVELRTVTGVRYGLGFQVPRKYAEHAHAALFGPADAVGDVVVDGVPEPHVNDVDDTQGHTAIAEAKEPPRSGRGSGEAAWVAFLQQQGVDSPADATRDELIELWDAHRNA